jgi:hypothetical protein
MKWWVRIGLAFATVATLFSAAGAPAAKAVSHVLATPAVGRVSADKAHVSAQAAEMAHVNPHSDPFKRAFYACVWTRDLRYRLNGVPPPHTSDRNRTRPQRRAWIPWDYYEDAGDCGGD